MYLKSSSGLTQNVVTILLVQHKDTGGSFISAKGRAGELAMTCFAQASMEHGPFKAPFHIEVKSSSKDLFRSEESKVIKEIYEKTVKNECGAAVNDHIGVIRIVVVLFTLLSTWYFAETLFSPKWQTKTLRSLFEPKKTHNKCGTEKSCEKNYFAFKIISGAASVVGPTICLEDKILMSSVKNNVGRGLNLAIVNATTGSLLKTGNFDMYSGDVEPVKKFMSDLKDGTLVLLASFDDPATKLDQQAREIFVNLGSNFAKHIGFRDSWVFVGAKGLKNKSPFEQRIKNDKETNKYDGWPEVLEMEGCIPRKMD
ncbi:protein FAM3D [Gastrophryne carolinensis]